MNLAALLQPLTVAVVLLFAVAYPLTGVWEYRRLVRWNAEGLPDARLRHYRWLIASEWFTVVVLLAAWFATGRGAAAMGLVPIPAGWQWVAIAAAVAISAFLVLQLVLVTRSPDALRQVRGKFEDLAEMVPRNPREMRGFRWLSLTAGICEEIMYRGVLTALLVPAIGTWPAVILASVLFGLAHIYQGPTGFAKTGAVGLVLALLTVFSGSLYAAILVHVVMDVISGEMALAAATLPDEPPVAVTS